MAMAMAKLHDPMPPAPLPRSPRSGQRGSRTFDWVSGAFVLCAFAGLTLVLWLVFSSQARSGDQADDPRQRPALSKGQRSATLGPSALTPTPRLYVYRKRGQRIVRVGAGARARRGDLLQLGYDAAGALHGAIFSLDGRGRVSLHFPRSAGASTRLSGGRPHLLPYAFELDDAPSYEHFVMFLSDRPIAVRALRAQLKRDGIDPPGTAHLRRVEVQLLKHR
jgi:hypothetical protein